MTIIVWDGITLAADKQATNSGLKLTVTKIRRIREHLVGFSGDLDYAIAMTKWFEDGAKVENFPKHQEDNDKWIGMIVITPDNKVLKYERSPHPIDFTENRMLCLGCGRDFAFGALAMGADARKAVMIACLYDSGCGMGIDTLTLTPKE